MKKNYVASYESNSTSAQAGSFSCHQSNENTETKTNIIIKSAMIIVLFLLLCLSILLIAK